LRKGARDGWILFPASFWLVLKAHVKSLSLNPWG
jgi:hypothetical protein